MLQLAATSRNADVLHSVISGDFPSFSSSAENGQSQSSDAALPPWGFLTVGMACRLVHVVLINRRGHRSHCSGPAYRTSVDLHRQRVCVACSYLYSTSQFEAQIYYHSNFNSFVAMGLGEKPAQIEKLGDEAQVRMSPRGPQDEYPFEIQKETRILEDPEWIRKQKKYL
ncbi:hypothetical protein BDV96DRAFT_52338 [Lophiotrema nucula]|uniref:Uncharacterized protein n=1 Tax=Lophiotrema nucula TaxID=690887 RepID=A0A6A5ZB16_9PLEO|nr:hypothetical protein BDV96DRAFT_52338 [Lophiotrema nucula]